MARRSAVTSRRGSTASTLSAALLSASLLTIPACSSNPPVAGPGDAQVPATPHRNPADFNLALAPPPVFDPEPVRLQPRTGADLIKARRDFAEILPTLEVPVYVSPPLPLIGITPTEPAVAKPNDGRPLSVALDPDAAAVKAYVLGRAAFDDGDRWKAIEQLEQAHRLDPTSAPVLRLLGKIYFAYGNQIKGAERLKEALKLAPGDSETVFLLGRFAFQQGKWNEAVVLMDRSAHTAEPGTDPAVQYLRPYYIGQCLLQLGDDAAAVEQLKSYLQLPEQFARTTGMVRELGFLGRQRGIVQVQVGDALCRLGRFDEAYQVYTQTPADNDPLLDSDALTAREVYALVAMNDLAGAQRVLLGALAKASSSDRALKLVPWLAQQVGHPDQLAARIRDVYQHNGRPAPLALAAAKLMPDDAAASFLLDHLQHKPADEVVFDALVTRLGSNHPERLLTAVIQMIRREPRSADRYAAVLTKKGSVTKKGSDPNSIDPNSMLALVARLPAAERDSAAGWYVRGALEAAADRIEKASEDYDKAFAADPTFLSPQLATVRLKVRLGKFDDAMKLLDELQKTQPTQARTPEVREVRVEVDAGLNRYDDAIAILDKLITQSPRDVKYRIQKASIQREKRDFDGAERTLWGIFDVDPTSEPAYTALFNLYDDDTNPHIDYNQFLRLLKQVQREIPHSRIARLKMAEWYAANRVLDRAEDLLRGLIKDRPDDVEALAKLASVLGMSDRWGDAEKIIIEQVDKHPDDANLLRLYGEVAQKLDHMDQFYPRMESFLKRQKPSFDVYRQFAQLYTQWQKPQQAVDALQKAIQLKPEMAGGQRLLLAALYDRLGEHQKALDQAALALKEQPAQAAEIHYFRASVYNMMGDVQKSETELLASLKANPDYAPANNDLGFEWAEQGRHLTEAEQMVLKAIAAEPENGGFLDSLGWVYYKLGRFQEGLRRLEEARTKPSGDDPVILDHLGDTLWRLKQSDRAAEFWRAATKLAAKLDAKRRPELVKLAASLQAKLKAITAGTQPTISPTAAELQKKP